MNQFKISQQEIEVLKNFTTINQSMVIQPNKFEVKNNANSLIGIFDLPTPYDIEQQIGFYDMANFLSLLSVYNKTPDITYNPEKNRLHIKEGRCSNNYGAHATELIEAVPDIRTKFTKVPIDLDFIFSQEKLVMLKKMSDLQKSKFIFFETVEDCIRITVGNELGSSDNTWEILLSVDNDTIVENKLTEVIKINVNDLKFIVSDYHVQIAQVGITKWESSVGVEYYVGLDRS